MTWLNVAFNNFIGGEISPDMYGRYDIDTYKKACEALINFLVRAQGPAFFRPGFAYVTHTRLNKPAKLKKFVFNSDESYVLEFTDLKLRFFKDKAPVTEVGTKKAITAVTKANPGVVTCAANGYSNGDETYISEIEGMTELNGGPYFISDVAAGSYKLKDAAGAYIDTSAMTAYDSGGVSTRVCKITNITTATQAVFTSVGHGYSDGDEIYQYDNWGVTSVNGKSFIVSDATADTYKLKDLGGNYISTVGETFVNGWTFEAGSRGGYSNRVYEVDTPYLEADLPLIQIAQSADSMYIAHSKYQPRKLNRKTDNSWALATFTGTLFPFTSKGNFPRAVAFAQGRLWYGGTDNAPDKFWGSRGPKDDGTTRYDDFTTGTADDNAVLYFLASSSGKVEGVRWLGTNNKYLVIGTTGGVSKVTGASDDYAISATSVNVRQLSSYGCESVSPIVLGNSMYYIQRGKLVLREIYYDVYQDSFVSENRTLLASRIVGDGITKLDFSSGRLDILWARREDGALIGMSVNKSENVFGWHRHIIGGDATKDVEDFVTIPQSNWDDQLWTVVKRTINGVERRYIEYLTDEVLFPSELDFYTGDKEDDKQRYANVIFSKQQECKHLDCHLTFDGSVEGANKEISLAISHIGTWPPAQVTITADKDIFASDCEGQQIWEKYDSEGNGGDRYLITGWVSATVLSAELMTGDLAVSKTLGVGEWSLTTSTITGLEHLEGETVQVVSDGGVHPDCTVSDGGITLEASHSVVHVGYGYRGIMKTLNLEGGGINGPAQTKSKKITDINVRFSNTLGASVGSDIYNMEPVLYASTDQLLGRPPQPYSGFKKVPINDEWVGDRQDDIQTHAVIVQDYPLPCEVQVVDVYFETTNE